MNKQRGKKLTLKGTILLIIAGIILKVGASVINPNGLMNTFGWVLIIFGVIKLMTILLAFFKN